MMCKRFLVLCLFFLTNAGYCSDIFDISLGFNETIVGENYTVPIDMIFYGEKITCNGCLILHYIKQKIGHYKVIIECSTNRNYHYSTSWELAEVLGYKIAKELILMGVNPLKIMYLGYTSKVKSTQEQNVIIFKIKSKWW